MPQGSSSTARRGAAAPAAAAKSKGKMALRMAHSDAGNSSRTKKPAQSQKKPHAAIQSDQESDSDAAAPEDDDLELEQDYDQDDDQDDEPDTEDEIEAAKHSAGGKSKKTAKRKRRATSPTSFGLALEGLLGGAPESSDDAASPGEDEADGGAQEADDAEKPAKKRKAHVAPAAPQGSTILSLAPHLRRSAQSVHLNARASRIAIEERRAREERARVKDVIGGWGPPGVLPTLATEGNSTIKQEEDEEKLSEWALQGGSTDYERGLRKVAQRGVVKLFNAIRAAQATTKEDLEAADSHGGKADGKGHNKNSLMGGKESRLADLSKNNFLDLIRKSSGGASKSSVAAK